MEVCGVDVLRMQLEEKLRQCNTNPLGPNEHLFVWTAWHYGRKEIVVPQTDESKSAITRHFFLDGYAKHGDDEYAFEYVGCYWHSCLCTKPKAPAADASDEERANYEKKLQRWQERRDYTAARHEACVNMRVNHLDENSPKRFKEVSFACFFIVTNERLQQIQVIVLREKEFTKELRMQSEIYRKFTFDNDTILKGGKLIDGKKMVDKVIMNEDYIGFVKCDIEVIPMFNNTILHFTN